MYFDTPELSADVLYHVVVDHEHLILGEAPLASVQWYVAHLVIRLYLADVVNSLVENPTYKERVAILGFTSWKCVQGDGAEPALHPAYVAPA